MRILTEFTRLMQKVFAPSGNLLVRDLLAEVTVHITSDGQRRVLTSKVEGPGVHQVVQGLVGAAIDLGHQFGISVNWVAMNQVAPYQGVNQCFVCKADITPKEPFVWVLNPGRVGHIKCVVQVEEKP